MSNVFHNYWSINRLSFILHQFCNLHFSRKPFRFSNLLNENYTHFYIYFSFVFAVLSPFSFLIFFIIFLFLVCKVGLFYCHKGSVSFIFIKHILDVFIYVFVYFLIYYFLFLTIRIQSPSDSLYYIPFSSSLNWMLNSFNSFLFLFIYYFLFIYPLIYSFLFKSKNTIGYDISTMYGFIHIT